MKRYGVYMMCSYPRTGAIYTGMSGNVPERALQNAGVKSGGAAWAIRFKARHLVYYELVDDYARAREREAQIKKFGRVMKIKMIEEFNPAWSDVQWELAKKLSL
ncbi:MAG: GIY-YIG nuclease family protein [Alphaproteobacteria bacterium]|nr:MAG: GIY-YIG nuclease family protein [Alphaproteobacteria bacterium]